MVRRLMLGGVFLAVVVMASGCVTAPTPVPLTLPAATAFSILGHSCGGIQHQDAATGFDPATGHPIGTVYLQTRCSSGGRGGSTVTYSAWVGVTWDFAATVVGATKLAGPPASIDPALSVTDGAGDRVFNSVSATNVAPADCVASNVTYCAYRAFLSVPVPTAPTGVGATQAGDSFVVTWIGPTVGGAAVTASTVTATPANGGAVLTATAPGAATTATVDGVAPSTTYTITVKSTDVGGTGPASAPITLTTHAATIAPAAPVGLAVAWDGSPALQATWAAPAAGDSPIDDYQVQVAQHDPAGPPSAIDAGLATTATLSGVDSTLDWSVQVRAHNAAGWGPWSAPVVVPALD